MDSNGVLLLSGVHCVIVVDSTGEYCLIMVLCMCDCSVCVV